MRKISFAQAAEAVKPGKLDQVYTAYNAPKGKSQTPDIYRNNKILRNLAEAL